VKVIKRRKKPVGGGYQTEEETRSRKIPVNGGYRNMEVSRKRMIQAS